MSSRATMALRAGMTDFEATSQGIIKQKRQENAGWNLFKHNLRHNFPDGAVCLSSWVLANALVQPRVGRFLVETKISYLIVLKILFSD